MALTTKVKVLAAAVLVACGLTTTLGTGRLAEANAQPPGKTVAELKQPQAKADAELALDQFDSKILLAALDAGKNPNAATFSTQKWDYDLVICSDLGQSKFADLLKGYEDRGWDYHGTTPIVHESKKETAWVFRRPVVKAKMPVAEVALGDVARVNREADTATLLLSRKFAEKAKAAEVRQLERQLADKKGMVLFFTDELPLDSRDFIKLLNALIESRFKGVKTHIHPRDDGLALEAPVEVRTWAETLMKKLKE